MLPHRMVTPSLLEKWFRAGKDVVVFIDGFSGMGHRKSTTAIKFSHIPTVAQLDGGLRDPPEVFTAMEWRGDESLCGTWMGVLGPVVEAAGVTAKFLVVDQKAAFYILGISGSAADKCFIFSKLIGRSMWKDVKSMRFVRWDDIDSVTCLVFEAGVINPGLPEYLQGAIVVPPMFHMYQKVQQYVIETFCSVVLGLKDNHKVFFDAVAIQDHGHRFHGKVWESGEARKGISWAEVTLAGKPLATASP